MPGHRGFRGLVQSSKSAIKVEIRLRQQATEPQNGACGGPAQGDSRACNRRHWHQCSSSADAEKCCFALISTSRLASHWHIQALKFEYSLLSRGQSPLCQLAKKMTTSLGPKEMAPGEDKQPISLKPRAAPPCGPGQRPCSPPRVPLKLHCQWPH